ncbi:MAG: hypothetical protein IPK63_19020 [Candidatus Competibacteraceae bacterium]|nr:hypothetical protein [Candidatus Competibacteraceae bacterium]
MIACPACSHAACKLCGSFIKPPSAESSDRLICPQCQGEYSSDRQEQEEREKRQPPTSMDGDLVLMDGDRAAAEKNPRQERVQPPTECRQGEGT